MNSAPQTARRLRHVGVAAFGALAALLLVALLLLSFGWGLLRPLAERRASAALGRPVAIARIRRVGGGLLHPLLAIEGVSIAQPGWAGGGDMIRLRAARVRMAALPLLAGRLDPQVTLVEGLRAALIRSEAGEASWDRPGPKRTRGGPSPDLGAVVVHDAIVTYDDRQHRHSMTAGVEVDARGLRIVGRGDVAGTPASIVVTGAPVRGSAPWPFRAEIRSPAVTLRAQGAMRTPLDLGHFTARIESSGRGLDDLDRLIAAGLPPTQPYRLTATIRHEQPAWIITRLAGTIGRSDLAGALSVHKHGDRTLLDGTLASNGFDFDDLASDAALARAAADARRIGPRLFPATQIHLEKLRRTDGTIRIDIRRILSRKPSVFRSVNGTLTLDHGVLTLAPVTAGMAAGTLAGSVIVRHQTGQPLLLVDLRLTGSRVERMLRTNGIVAGPLAARMRLGGHGRTVRDAIGRADGRIALVVPGGTITRRVALFLGADIGRGLFAGNSDRTEVRCIVAAFAVGGGVARAAPLVFDTPVARADGSGTVRLASEAVAIDLHGLPKKDGALRLNGPIEVRGTIERPAANPPPQTKSVGSILKMVGKALGGGHASLGTDADCQALAAAALR